MKIRPSLLALFLMAPAPAALAAEGGVGFPQLDVTTYSSQVFWLAVSFTLLYILMTKVALPGVGNVIGRREEQRSGNLSKAADMQQEAEKMQAAYEKSLAEAQGRAQETLRAAEQEIAEKNAAETSRFGEHARKRVATAETAIAKAKAEALNSLADISADIAADMATKISGTAITKADAKKAVTTVMQKG